MKNLFSLLVGSCLFWLAQTANGQCLIKTMNIDTCDFTQNDPALWNSTDWWDARNKKHDLPDAPVNLQISVHDTCGNSPIHPLTYVLLLDLDGDYIFETRISGDSTSTAGYVLFGNTLSQGSLRQFDFRQGISPAQRYSFVLKQNWSGDTLNAQILWQWYTSTGEKQQILPQLPYGRYRVEWWQGQQMLTAQEFRVRDCLPPTISCIQGLVANIMPNGMITVWASDVPEAWQDNYTISEEITLAIRIKGNGTGFPIDANGMPEASARFFCMSHANTTQTVEAWAKDLDNNVSNCETNIIIQDPFSICVGFPINQYCFQKEDNTPIRNVSAKVYSTTNTNMMPSTPSLYYTQQGNNCLTVSKFSNIMVGEVLHIEPVKNDNHLNGVTTFDLLLISRHILGVSPLTSPYKIIAADINKSNSVTANDMVELRKLILGVYSELPKNTSWRFVPQNYQFPEPTNPFKTPFPEEATFTKDSPMPMLYTFIGLKVGDTNGNASSNLNAPSDDRSTTHFTLPNRKLFSGETYLLPLSTSEKVPLEGWQMELQTDPRRIQILEVLPGTATDFSGQHFSGTAEGKLAISWTTNEPSALATEPNQPLIYLKIKALQNTSTADAIYLEETRMVAEVYPANQAPQNLKLQFLDELTVSTKPNLLIYPNPTQQNATLEINLWQPSPVRCHIFDTAGKMIWQNEWAGESGENQFLMDIQHLPAGCWSVQILWDETVEHRFLIKK